MKLVERSVTDLLAAFRSSSPTPGGGSASALAGAVGASLLAMVAQLPKSRTSSDDEASKLSSAGARCTALAEELAGLVDRDTEAYDLVVGAYRRPKATDEEKAARSAAIESALYTAIDAPLAVMRACDSALEQAGTIARFGNASASSDVQVGMELLAAAVRGAKLNVDINLGSVKDAGYAERVRAEADALVRDADRRSGAARAAPG